MEEFFDLDSWDKIEEKFNNFGVEVQRKPDP